ncbi:MAG TPA: hypothetical protein VH650_08310 [Gaiellaceae bacterium]|jgi:hypothetical protein
MSSLERNDDIRGLVELACEGLRPMVLPSGLACEELVAGNPVPRGRSLRYSVMTWLGLTRAEAAGYEHGFDLDRMRGAFLAEVDSPELAPGDLGLYLWADARAGGDGAADLGARLGPALAAGGGLEAREGMELAWIVQGLALQDGGADGALEEALGALLAHQAPSGLFHHSGQGARRRFPNFATQIYSVLALATVARAGADDRALPAARKAADRLLALQLPDGGWPWLYDADTGRVVERYEVYSVHQHGMAPMALLELAEIAGEPRYAAAAGVGLAWIEGRNELGLSMVDEGEPMIYRSLRRRRPWDRLVLYGNTAASRALRRPLLPGSRKPELNATCRPYELGWLCEAWAGREDALAGL